jgi:hypothetical protein
MIIFQMCTAQIEITKTASIIIRYPSAQMSTLTVEYPPDDDDATTDTRDISMVGELIRQFNCLSQRPTFLIQLAVSGPQLTRTIPKPNRVVATRFGNGEARAMVRACLQNPFISTCSLQTRRTGA